MPKIVALCGWPGSGKTTAQEILVERYGAIAIDDGWPLRDFAMRHLGLSLEDVTTQAGKAKTIEFAGQSFTVRWFLGEFGKQLEALLGKNAIAELSARLLEPDRLYVAGSVRGDQAQVWRKAGDTIVVEIDNPLAGPSPHDFDRYNDQLVDFIVQNHGLAWGHAPAAARRDLTRKLDVLMENYFGLTPLDGAIDRAA